MEVGDIFWKVAWSEEGHELTEWRARTIRRPPRKRYLLYPIDQPLNPVTIYYVQKINGITWVKRSNKNFDYGWDQNIDDVFRLSQPLDEFMKDGPSNGLKTTKLQAYNYAINDCEKTIKRWAKKDPDDIEFIEQLKRTLTSMKSRRSRLRTT